MVKFWDIQIENAKKHFIQRRISLITGGNPDYKAKHPEEVRAYLQGKDLIQMKKRMELLFKRNDEALARRAERKGKTL